MKNEIDVNKSLDEENTFVIKVTSMNTNRYNYKTYCFGASASITYSADV